MFDRSHGPSPEEAKWEGWTPPWMEHEGVGPRGPFGRFGGHGWHRGPRGWHGPFGFGFGRHWGAPPEFLALRAEAIEVAQLFAIASRGALENKDRLLQLRDFLDRSRKELSDIVYGSAQGSETAEGTSGTTDIGQA